MHACELRRSCINHDSIMTNQYTWQLLQVTDCVPSPSTHLLTALMNVQVTALQNGNSFNTMFTQNAQVQTISVNRTSTYITVEGFFSNANVTSTGTQACGVCVPVLSYCTPHDAGPSLASVHVWLLLTVPQDCPSLGKTSHAHNGMCAFAFMHWRCSNAVGYIRSAGC